MIVLGLEADHVVLRFDQSRVLDVASAPSSPQKALFKSLPAISCVFCDWAFSYARALFTCASPSDLGFGEGGQSGFDVGDKGQVEVL